MNGQRLLGDERVRFLLKLAAFAVAKNDVAHREFLQHARADFAGEGAEIVLAHVLRGEANVGIQNGLGDFAQGGVRRSNHDVHFLHAAEFALEIGDEGQCLGDGLVHLPVSGNDQFAFFVHFKSFSMVGL